MKLFTKKSTLTVLGAIALVPIALFAQPEQLSPPAGVSQQEFRRAYQSANYLQTIYRAIYENVRPSVVQVIVELNKSNQPAPFQDPFYDDPFFRKFFGIPDQQRGRSNQKNPTSLGSGFIIDTDGYIVTNNHVVADAKSVKIKLYNGEILEGKVRGTDDLTDIAIIETKKIKGIKAARLGDSNNLHVGDISVAVGNPFGLDGTFTTGIISAVGRAGLDSSGLNFIQTDASINQGNSGGPLLNMDGEVVGINRMIVSPSGGSVGIGFAIPINEVRNVITQIKTKGSIDRPLLGINVSELPPEVVKAKKTKGLFVIGVYQNTGAAEAGVTPHDIILDVDGKVMTDPSQLVSYVLSKQVGDRIILKILRKDKILKVSVKLSKR